MSKNKQKLTMKAEVLHINHWCSDCLCETKHKQVVSYSHNEKRTIRTCQVCRNTSLDTKKNYRVKGLGQ